jgi:DNA repair exonuclease SbcCD ATPase subunit
VVGAELRELSTLLACVNICDNQRQELARLDTELAKLPADPAGALALARQEHDRLTSLSQVLPLLCRFRGEREELRQADKADRSALAEQSAVQKEGESLKAAVAVLVEELTQVTEQRRSAEENATAARTLLHQAKNQLSHLDELTGASVCGLCGQTLTTEHLDDERSRRRQSLARADAASTTAAEARSAAIATESRLLQEKHEKEEALKECRDRYRDCRHRQQEAEREAQRRGRECLRLYHELPEPLRQRIAPQQVSNWLTTTYPSKDDLDFLQQEARGTTDAQRRLQEAQVIFDLYRQRTVERETIQRALAAQEATLPGDVAAVRLRHGQREAEDVALKANLKSRRADWQALQEAVERMERDQRTVREQLADKEQRSSAEEVRREEFQKALELARVILPETWRSLADGVTAADVERWQTERQALEENDVETRGTELAEARSGLEALRRRVAELEEEAERVPPDARCDPADVKTRLAAARQEQAAREAALLRARQDCERLSERSERRRQLAQEHAAADRQHNLHRLLFELVGRNRLQLFLVRQAERGIVDYANAVLDRLSGGQLYLRLRGEDDEGGTDQALQLEAYNRSTGQAPIGVAFLSGSQRFRVAVSLALGIGQHSSRQHRPIESVIIDEGFGCLDRQGRQVMIQELQNLRGQLRCILLVSHQEEFAEAFADGYHFTLNEGSTQVTRFQR